MVADDELQRARWFGVRDWRRRPESKASAPPRRQRHSVRERGRRRWCTSAGDEKRMRLRTVTRQGNSSSRCPRATIAELAHAKESEENRSVRSHPCTPLTHCFPPARTNISRTHKYLPSSLLFSSLLYTMSISLRGTGGEVCVLGLIETPALRSLVLSSRLSSSALDATGKAVRLDLARSQ